MCMYIYNVLNTDIIPVCIQQTVNNAKIIHILKTIVTYGEMSKTTVTLRFFKTYIFLLTCCSGCMMLIRTAIASPPAYTPCNSLSLPSYDNTREWSLSAYNPFNCLSLRSYDNTRGCSQIRGWSQTYHSLPSERLLGGVPTDDTAVGGGFLLRLPLTSFLKSSSIELLGRCTIVAAAVYFSSSLRVRRHMITAISITVTTAAPHIPDISGIFFCRLKGLKQKSGLVSGLGPRDKDALRARLPYSAPNCSQFSGKSEHAWGVN